MRDDVFLFIKLLDDIDMADSDIKGDLYECMLGKIAIAEQNSQFRTTRHIIKLMVGMIVPTPKDVICDPSCSTTGFLIAISERLIKHHSDTIYKSDEARRRFNDRTFHGYDFDNTVLCIGSMNMLLHGVENPGMRYKNSLAKADDDAEKYSLILANPPFIGSLDYEFTANDLQQIIKTRKTELLFLTLFLHLLQTGGCAAVIVLDGVLFGSSKAPHKTLRKILVEEQKRDVESERARVDQSFLVPKTEIADNDYDPSINHYKEVEYEAAEYDPPKVILERLAELEEEIAKGREELDVMLG